jgi:crossover junction endodeoxyribonuclease RuvC
MVAGLDLSLSSTGLVILRIDDQGVLVVCERQVKLESRTSTLRTARCVVAELQTILPRSLALVVVEGYAHGGPRLVPLVELGALMRDRLEEASIAYRDVAPSQLKKFVTGKGNADKGLMRLGVSKRWGFEHDVEDVVEAYGLARVGLALLGVDDDLTTPQREVVAKLRAQSVGK